MLMLAYMALLVPSVPQSARIVVGARSRATPECDGPQISLGSRKLIPKPVWQSGIQTTLPLLPAAIKNVKLAEIAVEKLHLANSTSALNAHDKATGLGHHRLVQVSPRWNHEVLLQTRRKSLTLSNHEGPMT